MANKPVQLDSMTMASSALMRKISNVKLHSSAFSSASEVPLNGTEPFMASYAPSPNIKRKIQNLNRISLTLSAAECAFRSYDSGELGISLSATAGMDPQLSPAAYWKAYETTVRKITKVNAVTGAQSTLNRSPPRSVLTINRNTSEIIIVNMAACRMFEMDYNQLIGRKLIDFLDPKKQPIREENAEVPDAREHCRSLFDNSNNGKVRGLYLRPSKRPIPVAMWVHALTHQHLEPRSEFSSPGIDRKISLMAPASKKEVTSPVPRSISIENRSKPLPSEICIVILEQLQRTLGYCSLVGDVLVTADETFAHIFGYSQSPAVLGTNIKDLIPRIVPEDCKDPDEVFYFSGRTLDGATFPITLMCNIEDEQRRLQLCVCAYSYLGGMVAVSNQGNVLACNDQFVQLLLGRSAEEIKGKPATALIPEYEQIRRKTVAAAAAESAKATTAATGRPKQCSPGHAMVNAAAVPLGVHRRSYGSTLDGLASTESINRLTSEEAVTADHGKIGLSFGAHVIHRDGGEMPVLVETCQLLIAEDQSMFCAWIHSIAPSTNNKSSDQPSSASSSSSEEVNESLKRKGPTVKFSELPAAIMGGSEETSTTTTEAGQFSLANSLLKLGHRCMKVCGPCVACASAKMSDERRANSQRSQCCSDEGSCSAEHVTGSCDLECGTFSDRYTSLSEIGKGSFGRVRLAMRKSDGLLVVVKFVPKSKVLPSCWTKDRKHGRVPTEISVLSSLHHQNVVRMLEFSQNQNYFQIVMENHGIMDLFEFIERRKKKLDEKLCSYIFRQIAEAVGYVISRGAVHRDLKDENVIIDKHFQCKLIDFGSAAYMSDKMFNTFCGTVEYCSPEVLLGNSYQGAEVEVWALGIVLYVLIFGSNPFSTPQDIIECNYEIPWQISDALNHLIAFMLCPLPEHRAAIYEVVEHPWTRQPVEITQFRFEEVARVTPDELSPAKYLSDLR